MNLPNKLTVLRIVLIPFMMFFYLADFIPFGIGKLIALAVFVIAAITDTLDGIIARKRNLITDLGKFLDPIADKILVAAVLFLIIADGTIPNPWGVIIVTVIIAREFIVSALRLIVASKGTVLAADIWGKIKTVVQMIALPLCILLAYFYSCGFNINSIVILVTEIMAYATLGASAILTVMSGANYVIKNRACFKETKSDK